uniref:Uncharacterized protein n=1 Tax=Rhizophora mucronata TaxID=61149 RepID=A0A2P2R2L3_RHIMU
MFSQSQEQRLFGFDMDGDQESGRRRGEER